MSEEFGPFDSAIGAATAESLSLSFWPGLTPLQQRWRNNGLSADFLGDYVTTFFPLDENQAEAKRRQSEIRGAVSFIANELLENAMKFHDVHQTEPIAISLRIDGAQILFQESNRTGMEGAERFKTYIQRLQSTDPGELFIQQMEENALSEGSAGLGYLTMINDYGAQLAWRFEPTDADGCRVTTQVVLKI